MESMEHGRYTSVAMDRDDYARLSQARAELERRTGKRLSFSRAIVLLAELLGGEPSKDKATV